jgi:signal transduction histidine kinase
LLVALQQAEEGIQLRDEFLALLSHQLNTPLSTLMLAAGRLSEPETHPDQVALARLIERQVRRLGRLMVELAAAADSAGCELAVTPQSTDLGVLVREVVAHFAIELLRAECDISLSLADGVMGRWDHERLEQMVFNLLSNACKFGRGAPIEVRLTRAAGIARLEIRDHGCGITPADRERLFTRFGCGSSARGATGLGLGLYTVRRIVEAHHGRVTAGCDRGDGATFIVELPCEPAHGEPQA